MILLNEKIVTIQTLCFSSLFPGTDDENNDSDTELVIDTEKLDNDKYDPSAPIDSEESSKEETVSSSVDASCVSISNPPITAAAHSTSEIQSEKVQSSSQIREDEMKEQSQVDDIGEDDADEDGCPNFSIYSAESINLAKTTDMELLSGRNQQACSEITSTPSTEPSVNVNVAEEEEKQQEEPIVLQNKKSNTNALYSDSEDDVKIDVPKSFGIVDIQNMTEDISEEERSYTPCLDEKMKACQEGLDGLDTEMISDEDRNDFDESHDLKTASDGDALEINAKDSELDFSKPEDYEEGEIVDKSKIKKAEVPKKDDEIEKEKPSKKEKPPIDEKNKENEKQNKLESSFKKLSKSNKERNYRDKDKERSRSRSKDKKDNRKDKKKEKRKEIERYDVRTIIAEKPRRLKDKFGRDVSKRSPSRSRSPSRNRRSPSRSRKRRSRSRHCKSLSRSHTPERRYSRSVERRRSKSRNRKRKRSTSYDAEKSKKRSRDRSRRLKSRSKHRSRSQSLRKRREWDRRRSREWTPSLSRSRSQEIVRHVSPSWTPPRLLDKAVKSHNLTVILTNDSGKKKKEKKKKSEKRNKESIEKRKKRRNKTPPPSKEVFASGDNILVSVSFNKDNETRDVTTKRKKDHSESIPPKKIKKGKTAAATKTKKTRDLSGVKPVAIIDLDKSPFKELTPSPKDVIVLSDSDNGENNEIGIQKAVCDSSQQVASPEVVENNNYALGPKTPPEPQIKFSLNPKPQQLRPITNPLHEPDEAEAEIDTQEEVDQRPAEVVHKGPNTPPDPPNSPPSSPDAYDPFDPTKSRSPTPELVQTNTQSNSISLDNSQPAETDKTNTPVQQATPDISRSHSPPMLEAQPDSQSSILTNTPDRPKSPDIAQNTISQTQNLIFPSITSKPVASALPYSSSSTSSLITSTPVSSNLSTQRINILNSTILTPPHVVSSVQQRIVLPNTVKSSPVKVPIKSTPIKPMPTKNVITKAQKQATRKITRNDSNDVINLDFDSPYSPGSSDYEDLFEPPPESGIKPVTSKTVPQKNTKSPIKPQNAFDSLFGSSPLYGSNKSKTTKNDKANKGAKKNLSLPVKGNRKYDIETDLYCNETVLGSKQIGVKLDEDNLKILDELPNSAVEMQVKDKVGNVYFCLMVN